MNEILGNSLRYFSKCSVILRRWVRGMNMELEELKTILAWIKLNGIPSELMRALRLSFIASHLGHLLLTNVVSANQGRLNYARVCVEPNVECRLSKEA